MISVENLKEFFVKNPKAALAFSGGTDSAYLLYAANECGADVQPYYIKTAFQPEFEYIDALKLCDELNIKLNIIEYDILSDESISQNPPDRCYYCKKRMFTRLKEHAAADGYDLLTDGTNASDNADDRPGMRALKELGVRSPLRECGLTKDTIRELSKNAGLFTWNKPAYACLATRVPTGSTVSAALLRRIECAENELAKMGFSDFRVRVYGGAARIQLREDEFAEAAERHAEIRGVIKPYFDTVLLDTETR